MTEPRDDIARRQNRLVKAVEEALSVAKGEKPSASIYVNGHKYVPATQLAALSARVKELEGKLANSERWRKIEASVTRKSHDRAEAAEARATRIQQERDEAVMALRDIAVRHSNMNASKGSGNLFTASSMRHKAQETILSLEASHEDKKKE